MTSWIISSNNSYFDLNRLFTERQSIDWKQERYSFSIGDVIYFYCTAPEKRIRYKGVVTKINLDESEIDNDSEYTINRKAYIKNNKLWIRVKFLAFSKDNSLTLNDLRKNGYTASPQRPSKIASPQLRDYIESFMQSMECTYPESEGITDTTIEGAKKTVVVNVYERNPIARAQCIDHNGCSCYVCGMDFGKVYGEFASGFIHVHHIKPISEIGKEYKVDAEKDLIPVCPNCHAAIHMKLKLGCANAHEELKKLFQLQ